MTTSNEPATDDEFWRRPADPEPPAAEASPEPAAPPAYPGPPSVAPPAPNWRPPLVVQPLPPRQLPAQDHDRLDADERGARTLTYGIGMVAGAVLLVVTCLLCARVVF